jgi:hypothetical protein
MENHAAQIESQRMVSSQGVQGVQNKECMNSYANIQASMRNSNSIIL